MPKFPMPHRSSFGLARAGDILHVIGGHVGQFHVYAGDYFSSAVHQAALDGTWCAPIADYPLPVQGARAVEFNGDIIVFGGFIYEPGLDQVPNGDSMNFFARSTNEVYRYSAAMKTWSLASTIPRQRSSNIIERIGDRAYLLGGWDGTPWWRRQVVRPDGTKVWQYDHNGRFHESVEIFDLAAGRFVANNLQFPLPLRRAMTSAVLANNIVIVGGIGVPDQQHPEGLCLENVTTFDPRTGVFTDALPKLPMGLFSPGACSVGEDLVVVGGMKADHSVNKIVWVLKKGAKDWIPNSQSLKDVGTFHELIHVGGRDVLVIGGHNIDTTGTPIGGWERITID